MKYPTTQQFQKSANIAAIVLVVGAVMFFSAKLVISYFDNKKSVETLTAQIASKDIEIGSLRDNLSKTEEGKHQVEEAKKISDRNATAQASRASSAEADAANKGAQLGTISSQLSSVNSQLSIANTNLANVNRCIAKFNSIRPTITSYQNSQIEENRYGNLAIAAFNAGNYTLQDYYSNLSNAQTAIANNLWPQINAALNSVASGNCY